MLILVIRSLFFFFGGGQLLIVGPCPLIQPDFQEIEYQKGELDSSERNGGEAVREQSSGLLFRGGLLLIGGSPELEVGKVLLIPFGQY